MHLKRSTRTPVDYKRRAGNSIRGSLDLVRTRQTGRCLCRRACSQALAPTLNSSAHCQAWLPQHLDST